MKRKILGLLLAFGVATLLASCSSKEKLYLLNWDEYIDEELIDAFEDEYNCKVVYDTAD